MADEAGDISPVNRSKEVARRSYDQLSRVYDWLSGTSEWRFVKYGLAMLDAAVGEHVLEIGYGTGRALCDLAQAVGESGRVAGLDLSQGMRAVAERRLEQAGLLQRVTLECGDALRLPYADEDFDALFMSFTLELFDTPEIGKVLGECWRVLRPAGRIVIVAMEVAGRENIMTRLYAAAHRWLERFADCRPINPALSLTEAHFQLQEIERFRMWGLPVACVLAGKL
jgi:demethylmenaquinone methyltransferase/2-methoxy-6-polyprenyl-1,4-benzoquinol methylase